MQDLAGFALQEHPENNLMVAFSLARYNGINCFSELNWACIMEILMCTQHVHEHALQTGSHLSNPGCKTDIVSCQSININQYLFAPVDSLIYSNIICIYNKVRL